MVSGYPDGTFQADKSINRAEALKLVMTAADTKAENSESISFPDVKESDWFYDYVRKAFNKKIIKGYEDGSFKPANNITAAEALKIILVSFDSSLPEKVSSSPYQDVAPSDWYAPFIEYGKLKQFIESFDDGTFRPNRDITRGEFSEILYRAHYVKEQHVETFPLSLSWPVFQHPSLHYTVKQPPTWQKLGDNQQVIFWKQDNANHQLSFARTFPNSAFVVIAVDENKNGLSVENYVHQFQYDNEAKQQKLTLNGYPFYSVELTSEGITDYYLELPNKYILAAYSQVGSGSNKQQLQLYVRYIVGSIRYTENTTDIDNTQAEELLTNVRKIILVKGKGDEALQKFSDLVLFETDTIGIGTGPIDYYYSKVFDVTLKYERDSKTLLGVKEKKSSRF